MARKKIELIVSLGDDDKLTVQKSIPLFALWRSELTLAEFKILDTYLSRINSHKPDKRAVMFEKGELESILGVKRIRTEELDERLKHLMTSVKIENSNNKKGFTRIALFEEAEAEQDDYGIWQVKLECTQKAMKYFFNIENLGYLRYKLRCIASLSSRYTYILFIYLEANRFRKSWEVDIIELKQILNCDKEECYKSFKVFNDRLLKRVYREMQEKTECRYSYEPIKKGRSVVAVRFTVETLSKLEVEEVDENQMSRDDWQSNIEKGLDLWQEPLEPLNLTEEQYAEIHSLLVIVPEHKMPDINTGIEIIRYHYLDIKVKEILRRDKQKSIKNKFAYLVKLIKQDME